MKTNLLLTFAFVCISFVAFGQDSSFHPSKSKVTFKNHPELHGTTLQPQKKYQLNNSSISAKKTPVYRSTGLGSSSPRYDTYKKNDYGAGAITTDPNKLQGGGGNAVIPQGKTDSIK
jgi:hypothetical protein